jgi:hypothetical protein
MCPENWSYTVSTYPGTLEQAKAYVSSSTSSSRKHVTHAGPCGLCSSLQDLAVYLGNEGTLRDESARCGIRGRFGSTADGIACFRRLGFTGGCAAAWHCNSQQTARRCLHPCLILSLFQRPSNGAPPDCALAKCLECDETVSGPLFLKFAGRTRRNSGILSNIARPCAQIADLVQTNPCGG